ncbi:MAG: S1 RNA-binding domain-containing protein, partial [Desulfobacterales bacterium]|nr:S1 RNA-binding domain-containing protein [Desulfobacterales bacterium]
LAYRIDKAFSKEDILYLYLNQIYLGHGAYGVEAASENYFGKTVGDMNLAECAMLAGLPQAPSRYSPFRNMELATQRQIYVLNRMVEEKFITNDDAAEAINTKLDIKERKNWYIEEVPFYTEYIRQYVEKKYGSETLYREGLKVYTAVNIEMQKIARAEVKKGLRDMDKRQGYRGVLKHLPPEEIESFSMKLQEELERAPLEKGKVTKGVVIAVDDKNKKATVRIGSAQGVLALKDMKWARTPDPEVAYYAAKVRRVGSVLRVGDVIEVHVKGKLEEKDKKEKERGLWSLALEQTPAAQSALMSLETETGHVKVMVGGRDFKTSQFNRATQSRRQPGSAFKPILYAAALDKGYTAATVIYDTAEVHKDLERDFKWKPKNYKQKFFG